MNYIFPIRGRRPFLWYWPGQKTPLIVNSFLEKVTFFGAKGARQQLIGNNWEHFCYLPNYSSLFKRVKDGDFFELPTRYFKNVGDQKKKHIFHTVRLGNACAFWIVVHPFLCTKNGECTTHLYKLYSLRRRIQLFFPNMQQLPSKHNKFYYFMSKK